MGARIGKPFSEGIRTKPGDPYDERIGTRLVDP
jgi:hypothetical protein